MEWLEKRLKERLPDAIGHRVVHGGPKYWETHQITSEVIAGMRQLSPFDPDHLPQELGLVEASERRFPGLPQFACFDTAFHHEIPRVAHLLPIPRRYLAQGIRRYGFHGISCSYLMQELERVGGKEIARGRVMLAHLGNGASITAVRNGKSIDTSMGFTPTAGLPMGTRCGDLDPGLGWYLYCTENVTPEKFHRMVNSESGLLGVSETSADMRELLRREGSDIRAAEAVELFCYHARKWIGALAAALEGLDTLVFSGGIGENAAEIRARICRDLTWMGVALDDARNSLGAPVISRERSPVTVRVIRTDEELMIAEMVCQALYRDRRNADGKNGDRASGK
jgi:acetate kinase